MDLLLVTNRRTATRQQPTGRKTTRLSTCCRWLALAVCAWTLNPENTDAQGATNERTPGNPQTIAIGGAVAKPLTLTRADLATYARASVVTVNNGIETKYEGVWLSDVLKAAGVPLGAALRGRALAGYVVAASDDGYRVVFSLGEIDPDLTSGRILLADSADGRPLFGESGTFRLVLPDDKRGARSVRMLKSVHIVQLPD